MCLGNRFQVACEVLCLAPDGAWHYLEVMYSGEVAACFRPIVVHVDEEIQEIVTIGFNLIERCYLGQAWFSVAG